MTILKAHQITKRFISSYIQVTPFLTINSTARRIKDNGKTIYYLTLNDGDKYFFSKKISKKTYFNLEIKEKKQNHLYIKDLPSSFFTSIGLVDKETFYLAEDIMEIVPSIKKVDLEIDSVYSCIKGKEYLYIGKLYLNKDKPHETEFKTQLFSISEQMFLNFSSIKLIKFERNQDSKITFTNLIKNKCSDSKKLKFL